MTGSPSQSPYGRKPDWAGTIAHEKEDHRQNNEQTPCDSEHRAPPAVLLDQVSQKRQEKS